MDLYGKSVLKYESTAYNPTFGSRTWDSPDIKCTVGRNHCCLVLRDACCREIVAKIVTEFHFYHSCVLVVYLNL